MFSLFQKGVVVERIANSVGRNLSGLCGGRKTKLAVSSLMLMALTAPAYAQVANPFADASSTLQQWIGYGAIAGAIGVVTLAAIGLGKAIFRRLAS